MTHVTAIGGVFLKAKDPDRMRAWYRDHLGVAAGPDGGVMFGWREQYHPNARAAPSGRSSRPTRPTSRRAPHLT